MEIELKEEMFAHERTEEEEIVFNKSPIISLDPLSIIILSDLGHRKILREVFHWGC